MKHGSLFSGIGGFDLAASWMGWENIFQCEKDVFCRRVLNFYWPKAVCYEDIRTFDATRYKGLIDVLTGGFPCQPFSTAGRRKGTSDDRYLWPEMCRIIREVRPGWVVGENVLGLLNYGRGVVFEQVLADLEAEGYEAWTYILPAASVGAPHQRDRIWFIAHAGREFGHGGKSAEAGRVDNGARSKRQEAADVSGGLRAKGAGADAFRRRKRIRGRRQRSRSFSGNDGGPAVPNTDLRRGPEGRLHKRQPKATGQYVGPYDSWYSRNTWKDFPVESPVCAGNDGVPAGLDGITFSKWRDGSIRGAGNAIVPQVVFEIFKVIERINKMRI
jgi:DNA (cytosine-5)-methyltransferase 1